MKGIIINIILMIFIMLLSLEVICQLILQTSPLCFTFIDIIISTTTNTYFLTSNLTTTVSNNTATTITAVGTIITTATLLLYIPLLQLLQVSDTLRYT